MFFPFLIYNKHENVTAYQRRGIEITWCENVVSPHLHPEMGTWNFYEERGDKLDIIEGCFYHISDKFFLEVNEPSLMANKEDGKAFRR